MKRKILRNVILCLLVLILLRFVDVYLFSELKTYEFLVKSRVFSFIVKHEARSKNGDVAWMSQRALAKYGTVEDQDLLLEIFIEQGENIFSTEYSVLINSHHPDAIKYAIKYYDIAKINVKHDMAKNLKYYKSDPLYPQVLSMLKSEAEPFITKELPE